MNETLRTLKERRSIRKYKKEQISDEKLNLILEAGTYAPTGMGQQSPVMVVVQDKETIKELSKMNAEAMEFDEDSFRGAPTIVIVLADKECGPTYVEDGSLVMGNLMNAAHALDIDSCWIHGAKEVFETERGKSLLDKWGIKGDYIGVGSCILGYRDCEYPEAEPRKENYIVRV